MKYLVIVTERWIKGIYKFCSKNSITIVDRNTKFAPLLREGDLLFLLYAFAHEGYSKYKLIILNQCWLYLQILCLSDVMNGYSEGLTSTHLEYLES